MSLSELQTRLKKVKKEIGESILHPSDYVTYMIRRIADRVEYHVDDYQGMGYDYVEIIFGELPEEDDRFSQEEVIFTKERRRQDFLKGKRGNLENHIRNVKKKSC